MSLSDADFLAWLRNPAAISLVLIEAVANVGGTETTRYISTGNYVTGPTDTPANTQYLPIAINGIPYTSKIDLQGDPSMSYGDIEIINESGDYDSWFFDVWSNRAVKAWVGDPSWPRSDFRPIFDGVIEDIDSRDRTTLNLKIRDKLQRLNTPVSDVLLGGTTNNANAIVPVVEGEVFNMTPLLVNPVTLEYQVNLLGNERIIEVRDNGKPVDASTELSTGKFVLAAAPVGVITVSVQGDKGDGVYRNTISTIIKRLVKSYGKDINQFTDADIDLDNFAAFEAAHTQPVGAAMSNRENLLSVCRQFAASVGAQLSMTTEGKLQLLRIEMPPTGTPMLIDSTMMMEHSLKPVQRSTVQAAVKLGFCKNWTVQPSLLTTIPPEHKDIFATEWRTVSSIDSATATLYKLNTEPVQVDTFLLKGTDAQAESDRELAILKNPHTTYEFEGTPELLMAYLTQPVTLKYPRYGLDTGVLGQIVSISPNWLNRHVTIGVLI